MSDFGLAEELEVADKYHKRKTIIKWTIGSFIIGFALVFSVMQLHAISNNGNVAVGTNEAKPDKPKVATVKDKEKPSSNTHLAVDDNQPLESLEYAHDDDAGMHDVRAMIEEDSRRLREEWHSNALALSAKFARIHYLISTQDIDNIPEAERLEGEVTGDAIGLNIGASQGQPDPSLLAARQEAASLAQQTSSKTFTALIKAKSTLQGYPSDWVSDLEKAHALARRFTDNIQ